MSLLRTLNLRTYFPSRDGLVKAVDSVNLEVGEKERVGLIGETGCGKTVLGMSIMRLLQPSTRIDGMILYGERDLLALREEEMRRIRGREIAMILQNPTTSLNPVIKIVDQISEAISLHQGLDRREARVKAIQLLESVRIPDASRWADRYPHQLSGGMKERAMIAMGLACNPSFIIADEPTKGLDTDVKMQIIRLLKEETKEKSLLIITHDLGVAVEICDRIAIMYAGELLEEADARTFFDQPVHPYTRGFINSLPGRGLVPIKGSSPSLINPPSGCRFHPRCDMARSICSRGHPEMRDIGGGHKVRCFLCA